MKSNARGFRYALEALRRKREWELDAVRMELAQANRVLKGAADHLHALEIRFAAARHEGSRRAAEPRAFDLQWQRLAGAYLAELTRQIAKTRDDLRGLEAARREVLERVTEAHRALETLEKHRLQAAEELARAASRREYVIADENWLHRIPEGDSP